MDSENILIKIKSILENRVITIEGKSYNLHSSLDWEECFLLYNLLKANPEYHHTLEIGCACGLSSMAICAGIANRQNSLHRIIDPFQKDSWHSIGIKNLQLCSIDYFELIEKKSEFALPELTQSQEGLYDFIFIDGFHSFDHTMVDVFYSTRLLRVGGVLAIDDASLPSVRQVIKIISQYPCFQKIDQTPINVPKSIKGKLAFYLTKIISLNLIELLVSKNIFSQFSSISEPSLVAFKKIAADNRAWNWSY